MYTTQGACYIAAHVACNAPVNDGSSLYWSSKGSIGSSLVAIGNV